MPGLGARLGRGGATTFLQNLAESDCVVIMGANMAENHPVGFRFVVQARERGATVIHVDPRYTRTSASSDIHIPIRAGSDIALLGGLIQHVLATESFNREYVTHYTNATDIVGDDFHDTEELEGRFSGLESAQSTYNPSTWKTTSAAVEDLEQALDDSRSVLSHLRRHFARYTPQMVSSICGSTEDQFQSMAEAIVRNSTAERTTAFAYSVAWTQHTTGTQMIAC
ncbi:MAG: molybdopterin-dependent oxidoreductase [Chloroflexota bacterium]